MQFINLTPHPINLPGLAPIYSSGIARVAVELQQVGTASGVQLLKGSYGEIFGLPSPSTDTIYIVSAMVRAALPGRTDLASPAKLLRDESGAVIGCGALEVN